MTFHELPREPAERGRSRGLEGQVVEDQDEGPAVLGERIAHDVGGDGRHPRGIFRDRRRERDLDAVEQRNRLRPAGLAHLEVVDREVSDRPAVRVRDRHGDLDQVHTAAKLGGGRRRRLGGGLGRRPLPGRTSFEPRRGHTPAGGSGRHGQQPGEPREEPAGRVRGHGRRARLQEAYLGPPTIGQDARIASLNPDQGASSGEGGGADAVGSQGSTVRGFVAAHAGGQTSGMASRLLRR